MGHVVGAKTWETYNMKSEQQYIPKVEDPKGNNPECEIYFVPVDQTKWWGC